MSQNNSASLKLLVLLMLVAVGWNLWLPTAKDFFNHITPANENRPSDLQNVDFHAYYSAGLRFRARTDPYSWGKDKQGNTIPSDYIYPPTMLPVFSLISFLAYNQARDLWLILYALSYLVVLALMSLAFKPEKRFLFLSIALLLTLASYPLLDHLLKGQADIFVICLILGGFLAYTTNRRLIAAILLAVASLLKVSPVFLLIYYVIFLGDWRFLGMYAGAVLVIAAASLLWVPFGYYQSYLLQTLPQAGNGTSLNLNQSLLSYLTFSPFLARLVSVGGLGLLAVLMALLRGRYKPEERKPGRDLGGTHFTSEAVFILNLAWILIFIGKAWPATYVLAYPSLRMAHYRRALPPGETLDFGDPNSGCFPGNRQGLRLSAPGIPELVRKPVIERLSPV